MLEKSFGLFFFLKQPKNEKSVDRYVYLRITVDGQSRELSTKRLCDPANWSQDAGRAIGNKEDARALNNYLDVLTNQVFQAKLGKVYETLLCSPGMNETVKIEIKVNRKTILLLNSVIDRGLNAKEGGKEDMIGLVPEECIVELKTLSDECLKKAGLSELSEKIKGLAEG